jgi:hypothetical protein
VAGHPAGGHRPPVFYRPPTPEEVRFLREGRGGKVYKPQWVLGFPRCCPWGYPQVFCASPQPQGSLPQPSGWSAPSFPVVAAVESEGGVGRLETRWPGIRRGCVDTHGPRGPSGLPPDPGGEPLAAAEPSGVVAVPCGAGGWGESTSCTGTGAPSVSTSTRPPGWVGTTVLLLACRPIPPGPIATLPVFRGVTEGGEAHVERPLP